MSGGIGFEALFSDVPLPAFARIVRKEAPPTLTDPLAHALNALEACPAAQHILPGQRVAIAVGSREIAMLPDLVRVLVAFVRRRGASPCLVPAMGSHGGGTAEGQAALLEALGVCEASVGAPVISSMETVQLGVTDHGVPVAFDAAALKADHTILLARVKPHTDFHGDYESGVLKMLAVGLGKGEGAAHFHDACDNPSRRILDMAQVAIRHSNALLAMAVVEDRAHRPQVIRVHAIGDFVRIEPELLALAKASMPRIPFSGIDVLLIDEIGKNISGTGMDPNITGRPHVPGGTPGIAGYIAVLGLTAASRGNATGIGYADVITRRVYETIDMEATLRNCLTSRDTQAQKIPTWVSDSAQALRCCLYCAGKPAPRVVYIRNTLSLDVMYISEALLSEVDAGQYGIEATRLAFGDCAF